MSETQIKYIIIRANLRLLFQTKMDAYFHSVFVPEIKNWKIYDLEQKSMIQHRQQSFALKWLPW